MNRLFKVIGVGVIIKAAPGGQRGILPFLTDFIEVNGDKNQSESGIWLDRPEIHDGKTLRGTDFGAGNL